MSSSCCFNCSSSSSRTTVHTQKFECCTQNLAQSLPLQLKTSESLKLTNLSSQITAPFRFSRFRSPSHQLFTDRDFEDLEPKSTLPKVLMLLMLNSYSCQRSELGEIKMMMPMKSRSRWERLRRKEEDGDAQAREKEKNGSCEGGRRKERKKRKRKKGKVCRE